MGVLEEDRESCEASRATTVPNRAMKTHECWLPISLSSFHGPVVARRQRGSILWDMTLPSNCRVMPTLGTVGMRCQQHRHTLEISLHTPSPPPPSLSFNFPRQSSPCLLVAVTRLHGLALRSAGIDTFTQSPRFHPALLRDAPGCQ